LRPVKGEDAHSQTRVDAEEFVDDSVCGSDPAHP
jgi:hypothetical protein